MQPLHQHGYRFEAVREQFVNRTDVLERIERLIQDIKRGNRISQTIIHIWGPPGIGKTALLAHLQSIYECDKNLIVMSLGLDSLQPSPDWASTIAQLLYQQLLNLGISVPQLPHVSLNEIGLILQKEVAQRPLLLLFDDWAYLNQQQIKEITLQLLIPLLPLAKEYQKRPRFVAVISSQRQITQWHLRISDKVLNIYIDRFSKLDTIKQALPYNFNKDHLFRITHGIPLLIEQAFHDLPPSHQIQSPQIQQDFLDSGARQIIKRITPPIDENIHDVLKILVVLGKMDPELLFKCTIEFIPDKKLIELDQVFDIVKNCIFCGILVNCGQFYKVNDNIRSIIYNSLLVGDKIVISSIHEFSCSYYQNGIRNKIYLSNMNLIEEMIFEYLKGLLHYQLIFRDIENIDIFTDTIGVDFLRTVQNIQYYRQGILDFLKKTALEDRHIMDRIYILGYEQHHMIGWLEQLVRLSTNGKNI